MCFENSLQNVSIELNCDCPLECESISYSFSLVSTPFVQKEMCPRTEISAEFSMKEFYKNKHPPQFVRKLMEMSAAADQDQAIRNVSSHQGDVCKRNIQYRAEVIFRLATDSVSVTVMTRRLSFFDKLSAFGKYII